MRPKFLRTLYLNQLRMMEMRGCEVNSKHRNKVDNIKDITKDKVEISKLNGTYTRGEVIYKVFYIKIEQDRGGESNSKIIGDMITNTARNLNVEYILVTDVEEKNIKIMKNIEYKKRISLFTFKQMYIFPLDHYLVPKHTPVYYPENLMFSDEKIAELQTVPHTDIVIKMLGLKPGNIVIIQVHNPIACINERITVFKLVI